MECPICYKIMGNITFSLECGHRFHISCLNQWRKKFSKPMEFDCPYCRKKINWNRGRQTKDVITKLIKKKLDEVSETIDAKKKVELCTEIFTILNNNYKHYKNETIFKCVIKQKIIEISDRLSDVTWLLGKNISSIIKNKFITVTKDTNTIYSLNIEN
jgi:hypothetical protein